MTVSYQIPQPFPTATGSFLDHMPVAKQATWKSLFNSVNADTNAGVMALTHTTRQHYLRHWQELLPPHFNLYLQDLALAEQIALLQGFT